MATTSIGAPGVTFPDGTVQASAAGIAPVVTIYTSPATWTKPATVKAVKVTVVGGGGTGGNRAQPGTSPIAHGAGAGAAGIGYFPAPSIPGPSAITVGSAGPLPAPTPSVSPGTSGGSSSFGALITATGGSGTGVGPAFDAGAGGSITPSPAIVGINGQPGDSTTGASNLGNGGNTGFGLGFGANRDSPISNAAIGYGAGGMATPSAQGIAGKPGLVIVEEFY